MQAVKIKENIYWVGAIDWNLRNFHGYLTQRGSTYNAYLIIDERVTLIDTVKGCCADEMLCRISSVIDPLKIDYIVSNHVEMDHSGALPKLLELKPKTKIFTSPNGKKGLSRHFKKDWDFQEVKSGDRINLGKYDLGFITVPMVHWPDSMVTYLQQEKILFSNDAFGQHLAGFERFDDEVDINVVFQEAKKYYANIVLPYGNQVKKALEALAGLDIEIIAPSHGMIFRKKIAYILEKYKQWASNDTKEKALIIYDTMWKSTEKIAGSIYQAFEEAGITVKMVNLHVEHISDVIMELIESKYVCVGSPTLNNNMLPTVASFLTYMKGLSPKNRIGLAFGSYGWGGQSIGQIEEILKSCGFSLLTEKIRVNYIPDDNELQNIRDSVLSAINMIMSR